MKKTLYLIFALVLATSMPAMAQKKLPEGMTQEQYDAIQAKLPKGVTVEMVIANLPEGMTLEQALKIMAAQQAEKAKEAAAGQQAQSAVQTGTKKKEKAEPNQGCGTPELIPYFALNLGMTSSIGVPRQTRAISAAPYNFNFAIGCMVSQRFSRKWGIQSGLRIERKGNNSNVYMEDYLTRVHIYEGQAEEVQGYYTGRSQGFHDVWALTMPLCAMYQPNQNWCLYFGPYFSFQFSRYRYGISGDADGCYIRESVYSPTVSVDHSETDHSKKVSKWDCGVTVGCTRRLWRQLYMVCDLNWGLVNQWDGTDYGMKMPIFNIYGQLGFGWKFHTSKKK